MKRIQIFIDPALKKLSSNRLRDEMEAFYKTEFIDKGLKVLNLNTGVKIGFNTKGLKKQFSFIPNPIKLQIIPSLPRILRFAQLVQLEPNKRNNKFLMHRLEALLEVENSLYLFKAVVPNNINGEMLYDHFASEIKNPDAGISALGSLSSVADKRQSSGFLEPKVQQLRQNAIG